MLSISILLALLVGAMMYMRVADEVYQATGMADATSVVVGATLGAAVVVLNLYVLQLAFADGSEVTRRADGLARAVRSPIRRYERDQAKVDRLQSEIRLLETGTPPPPAVSG